MSKRISTDLLSHLQTVSEPNISPDESLIAYTLSWIDSDTMENCSSIVGLHSSSRDPFSLTQGTKDSVPQFSPNGKSLAFLRSDDENRRQLWLLPMLGGEPYKITHDGSGILEFSWSPDSDRIAYSSSTSPDLSEILSNGSQIPKPKKVTTLRYQFDTLGWRGDSHFHISILDIASGNNRQITSGSWDDVSPMWSPDGNHIAFISGRKPQNDVHAMTEAYVVADDGGTPKLWSDGLNSIAALAWNHDGSSLIAVGSRSPGFLALWQGWLYVLSEVTGPQICTDDTFRPCVGFPTLNAGPEIRWLPDNTVILLGESQGQSYIYKVNLNDGLQQRLYGGGILTTNISTNSEATTAVIAASSPTSPSDLFKIDLHTGAATQITNYNKHFLSDNQPASMERFFITQPDFNIECRMFFPPGFDSSQQYPMVLDIHGGPNGAFYDSFVAWQQVFAGAGYIVLAVNPRGSSTYGDSFMMSVIEDWGGKDHEDLLSAVNHAAQFSYVDASRIGVHGYSYGGYMASWMIGHTNRFKAAVIGAPCINLHSMYGTSDIGSSFGELQWGMSLDIKSVQDYRHMVSKLLDRSPISYVSEVETPALLLHGESDHRCPISQSEEYFTALKRLGKQVEMVRFPGCSHLFPRLGKPYMREAYLRYALEWFDRHM
ncbi:MAG: S9 family peptidase [Chloroflexota bacterium]|nr:S9 family peptidase [Chloroflexota bacterium]